MVFFSGGYYPGIDPATGLSNFQELLKVAEPLKL
jgi:hypothetical protein